MAAVELTSEQLQFLQDCEEAFSDRYTDHDDEYMESLKKCNSDPPVITPWHPKSNRRNDGGRSHQMKRPMNDGYDGDRKRFGHSSHYHRRR